VVGKKGAKALFKIKPLMRKLPKKKENSLGSHLGVRYLGNSHIEGLYPTYIHTHTHTHTHKKKK
jgi:hypothetical protein